MATNRTKNSEGSSHGLDLRRNEKPILILILLLSLLIAYYSPIALLILIAAVCWAMWESPKVLRSVSADLMARAVALEGYRRQHQKELEVWARKLKGSGKQAEADTDGQIQAQATDRAQKALVRARAAANVIDVEAGNTAEA